MTQQLVERYSKEHKITFEEALKKIESLMIYMPRREKRPLQRALRKTSYGKYTTIGVDGQ